MCTIFRSERPVMPIFQRDLWDKINCNYHPLKLYLKKYVPVKLFYKNSFFAGYGAWPQCMWGPNKVLAGVWRLKCFWGPSVNKGLNAFGRLSLEWQDWNRVLVLEAFDFSQSNFASQTIPIVSLWQSPLSKKSYVANKNLLSITNFLFQSRIQEGL